MSKSNNSGLLSDDEVGYYTVCKSQDYEFLAIGKGVKTDADLKHSHYFMTVHDKDFVDIYDICNYFVDDRSGCIQHAVKKMLCSGKRGVKDQRKDLQEAMDTLQRKLEILGDD